MAIADRRAPNVAGTASRRRRRPAGSRTARFVLTPETASTWVGERGLNPQGVPLVAAELGGGVSASVVAVTGRGVRIVVKQALGRLRVSDRWEAKLDRTESEVAAMELLGELTPDAVPRVLAHDPAQHVFAMDLLPGEARNWQDEIGAGRVHPALGRWAGGTLGTWHARTTDRVQVRERFGDFEAFEQQRLRPFHETVMQRRPELAAAILPYAVELRSTRRCLVDGDYAPKNTLVAPDGRGWVVDFEVAHTGNPVFDVGFFLSFAVLSAVRWPALAPRLRALADGFLSGYAASAGRGFAGTTATVTGHTACLVLSRTDGLSPAQFLDDESRGRAREVGLALLRRPEQGLWSWC